MTPASFTPTVSAAYSSAVAAFLQLPPSQVVSSVTASSAQDYMRMLQAGSSGVTIQSIITTPAGTQPQLEAMLGNGNANALLQVLKTDLGPTVALTGFSRFATPIPTVPPTPSPTGVQAINSQQQATAQQGGLATTTIIGIVVAILIVALAAAYIVYAMTKSKKSDLRGSNVAGVYNSYKDDKFGVMNPVGGSGFAPHIARGYPAQRYSGSAGAGGRRSIGNSIELADYRGSIYSDMDNGSVMSDNPHFNAPRLSLTRKSLAEHQMRSAAGGALKGASRGNRL